MAFEQPIEESSPPLEETKQDSSILEAAEPLRKEILTKESSSPSKERSFDHEAISASELQLVDQQRELIEEEELLIMLLALIN